MPDRIAELRRQHALLSEHLRWLERELANAERTTPAESARPAQPVATEPPPAPLPPPPPSALASPPPATGSPANARTLPATAAASSAPAASAPDDAILERYRVPPAALRQDVRKGCLMYFIAAFFLLIAGTAVLYYVLSVK